MRRRTRARLIRGAVYLVAIALVVVAAVLIDWERVGRVFFRRDIVADLFPEVITQAARNTLIFTAFGFAGGLVLGVGIALLRMSSVRPFRWFARVYIELFRGLPALLTILFVGFGLPIALNIRIPGTYGRGSVALAIVAAAYMAETIRSGFEAIPKGQMEAARSLGMSHVTALRTVIAPQAFRVIIPPLTNEFVLLLKDTALLSALGTTAATEELLKFARSETSAHANVTPLVFAGLVYLAMTIPLTQLVAVLERRVKVAR